MLPESWGYTRLHTQLWFPIFLDKLFSCYYRQSHSLLRVGGVVGGGGELCLTHFPSNCIVHDLSWLWCCEKDSTEVLHEFNKINYLQAGFLMYLLGKKSNVNIVLCHSFRPQCTGQLSPFQTGHLCLTLLRGSLTHTTQLNRSNNSAIGCTSQHMTSDVQPRKSAVKDIV